MGTDSLKLDAVFFCRSPARRTVVDEMDASEVAAAQAAGLAVKLVDHDAIRMAGVIACRSRLRGLLAS